MTQKTQGSSPFYALLNEINAAAQNRLTLLALSMVVALPDICVSMSSADGRTNGVEYKKWCADNLAAVFPALTPEDLYSMRCGVLHNGRFGDMKHSFARAIFMLPWNGNVFEDCQINDAYFYNGVEFVLRFTRAVYDWYEAHRDDPIVQANTERVMQYREGGFGDYISGVTVIA